jgi:uncharacterized membrane protein YhaH (DUF805 family)
MHAFAGHQTWTILLPEKDRLFWLFFRFSGRISRAVYILGFLFMTVVMTFPLYQSLRLPVESEAAQIWYFVFMAAALAALWVHIAFSVKRLHDIGRPGIIAAVLFIPVISIVAFVALCVIAGTPGPNQYGENANEPAGGA